MLLTFIRVASLYKFLVNKVVSFLKLLMALKMSSNFKSAMPSTESEILIILAIDVTKGASVLRAIIKPCGEGMISSPDSSFHVFCTRYFLKIVSPAVNVLYNHLY